ncbi:hypothetical protein [Aneurinibacillus aneurinilyticus]|uniref:Uncharacterized protein n=2 Tax=Aneurinibacillus aneurinilyticus TaxID=1391 RepID=U1WQD4_ANEAE|nr:hypothetical protein [Aneurinibacillus aneurinilyticus]ERI10794.1 hypothetical protein HMPREF0083_01123 [Aneurinibacillus aneurinilyticus ATCC 12856]MED0705302.1 hypothetical protein [Aneurinibacillus aneurinilyticus]MED0726182.1 hypothetical protein [Aneurinibacillus aneurinilyticus]MED0733753.1 hypothetical protein [Aneurinibacillus aneurinilyticus]MED0741973.1 hypothetical protein [Aneurinibacillus aneurinilyticus]
MVIDEVKLGIVNYQDKIYTAIREIYDTGEWKLVFVNEQERIIILTH